MILTVLRTLLEPVYLCPLLANLGSYYYTRREMHSLALSVRSDLEEIRSEVQESLSQIKYDLVNVEDRILEIK